MTMSKYLIIYQSYQSKSIVVEVIQSIVATIEGQGTILEVHYKTMYLQHLVADWTQRIQIHIIK